MDTAWTRDVKGFLVIGAVRLSEKRVRALTPPKAGNRIVYDTEVGGFGVRITAAGSRAFVLTYWTSRRQRRITIGRHPTWTVEAARREAKALRRAVDGGADPLAERHWLRGAPTVQDLAERYFADHLPNKAEISQRQDRAMIESYILPRLGKRLVAEVHEGDVEALHKAITAAGKPVLANRVLTLLSAMFTLATRRRAGENEAWIAANPCRGLARNPEPGRERFLSEREAALVSEALARYPARPAANCIAFLMLTGARPSEARHATWDQVDLDAGVWTKPSAHTKQRRTHRVPLNAQALMLLREIKNSAPARNDYLFPGRKPGEPLKQLHSVWQWVRGRATVAVWAESEDPAVAALIRDLRDRLRREPTLAECRAAAKVAKIKLPLGLTDTRPYDLRHTFASAGAGSGLSLPIIGALLGHTQARTTMRYAHLADHPLRAAADKIGSAITGTAPVERGSGR